MASGIIIDDNLSRRKMLSINFEMYLGITFEVLPNPDEAMVYLKKNPGVKCIICKNNMGGENTILKTFYYVNSNKLGIPIICLGNCFKLSTEKSVKVVDDVDDIKKVLRWTAKRLGITAEMMSKLETEKYYPVSTAQFSLLKMVPCDVYKNAEKDIGKAPIYEIFMKKGAEINKEIVTKLIFEKVQELYVASLDCLKFVNDLTSSALTIIKSAKSSSFGDLVNATGTTFEQSRKALTQASFSKKQLMVWLSWPKIPILSLNLWPS